MDPQKGEMTLIEIARARGLSPVAPEGDNPTIGIILCSETYTKVLDLRTGLYSHSTAYVYSILETEILTGKLG